MTAAFTRANTRQARLVMAWPGRTGEDLGTTPRWAFGQGRVRVLWIDQRQVGRHAPATALRVIGLNKDGDAQLLGNFACAFVAGNDRKVAMLNLRLTLHQAHTRGVVKLRPPIGQQQRHTFRASTRQLAANGFYIRLGRY